MKIRKQTKLWTDKNGRRVRICDLHDNHLVNTINMLRRAAAAKQVQTSLFYTFGPEPSGEQAQCRYGDEQQLAWEATWEDYVHKLYPPLLLDFARRELDAALLKEPPDGQLLAAGKILKAFIE